MNRNDWILFFSAIGLAIFIFIGYIVTGTTGEEQVVVRVDGESEKVYSLNEDQKIEISDGSNVIRIMNGSVSMVYATCPDQICVHHRSISKNRESIICLPNKVIVQIENYQEAEVDTMTN